MGEQQRRGTSAREWVLVIAVGVVIGLIGLTQGGTMAAVGGVIALAGVVGLLYRLVGDR